MIRRLDRLAERRRGLLRKIELQRDELAAAASALRPSMDRPGSGLDAALKTGAVLAARAVMKHPGALVLGVAVLVAIGPQRRRALQRLAMAGLFRGAGR